MKKETGFTLIEMLVVIAIVGLLSSVMLTGLGKARQKARDARRVSDILQVQNALEVYYAIRGDYPASLGDLPNPIPSDPVSGDYTYTLDGGTQGYKLGTCLELDRSPGIEHYNGSFLVTNLDGCDCDDTDSDVFCVKNFE